ncbi:hypothetical protein AB1Y20_023076 [Prymnesium parvum]|uniref:Uncharacterized protein n=1 Tax=Prymnesium parvum TaxID=97485 RepID=A0AB34JFQ5_PRYPA
MLLLLLAFPAPRRARVVMMDTGSVTWASLRIRLDQVPVFAIDAADGACTVYIDVDCARSAGNPYPTGLGTAYERAFRSSSALEPTHANHVTIVAAPHDVALASSLPGGEDIDWESGEIPLFGSYSMRRRLKDGRQVAPLFFSGLEAQKALEEATSPGVQVPELRSLSLQQMVEDMLSGRQKNSDGLHFVAPAASVRFTQEVQAGALPTKIDARLAMLSLFDGTMDARRSGSVFPT